MSGSRRQAGRHRLGEPGLRHCLEHVSVRLALEEYRRTWWTALLTPARHTLSGLRRYAAKAAAERAWVPSSTWRLSAGN